MKRLLLALVALAALLASGCATSVDRRAVTAKSRIDEARWSEAYRCAPAELARAEVNLDLANFDLADGDGAHAYARVADAEAAALAAIARARPCAPKTRPDDLDGDGVANAADLCPNVAGPVATHGCADTDGDLVFDDLDRCRLEAEDRDGFRDDDGCPDLDDDDDGVADAFDACRTVAGPVEGKGCPGAVAQVAAPAKAAAPAAAPASASARVKVGKDKIELAEKLQFQPYAGDLVAASYPILKELAAVLKDHPSMKLRIEGHTDSKGNAQVNNWMARERAKAVKAFLVKEGVGAGRLAATGQGFSKPIAPNTTEEGREANRRIELLVTAP